MGSDLMASPRTSPSRTDGGACAKRGGVGWPQGRVGPVGQYEWVATAQNEGVADLTEVGERIRAPIAATGADVVVLPIRVDERYGKSVYSQQDVLIVKRLKAEGIRAAYLDDSEDRVFVAQ